MAGQGHTAIAPGAPPTGAEIAPAASWRSVPIFMIAVFCVVLGGVLTIAVMDMVAPGPPPAAGQRAPSWPGR